MDTKRDLDSGVTTVRVNGLLTLPGAAVVRSMLDKCASECPAAVIVDLTALEVADAALLAVFAAAAQRAAMHWGVPLLLCCARPEVARPIGVFRPFNEIYGARGDAMRALRGWTAPRWRRQRFPPTAGSAARARHLVAEACTDWGLEALREKATLVASELASNAIEHAGTDFDITVSSTGIYLRIAVQDGSTAMPQLMPDSTGNRPGLDRGIGLYIVDAIATGWNTTPLPGGKVVWTLLRVRPLSGHSGESVQLRRIRADTPAKTPGRPWDESG